MVLLPVTLTSSEPLSVPDPLPEPLSVPDLLPEPPPVPLLLLLATALPVPDPETDPEMTEPE